MSSEAPLDWPVPATEIPERGMTVDREATPVERAGVADALELLSCDRIHLTCRIRPLAGGRHALQGQIEAALSQACVVSLDPVPAKLAIALDIEFQPGAQQARDDGDGADLGDPFAATEREPIEHGMLQLGRVVFEEIASNLEPFPRATGAELEHREAGSQSADTAQSPFAKLAALKNKPS